MVRRNKKKDIIEYVKTAVITLITVTLLIGFIVFDLARSAQNRMSSIIERISARFQVESISELLRQEERNPDDFMINIKLAAIYEIMNETFKAEEEYKKALAKAPRNETVLYRYALFCTSQDRFDEAVVLIENIPDSPDKNVIIKKLSLYQYMGDRLLEKNDYLNATKIYNIAYRYGRILDNKKTVEIKKRLTRASLLLADEYINEQNVEQAKLVLENLLKNCDSPEAKYKLSLIYRSTDSKKSAKIMDDLMKTHPELLNFNIYYSILQELVDEAEGQGDKVESDYYKLKREKMKKFIMQNVVFSDEFLVENQRFSEKIGTFGKKILSFDIKNLTPNEVNHLILRVDIIFPGPTKPVKKELMADFGGNESGQGQIANVNVLIEGWEYAASPGNSDRIKVEVFARKNNRFDWVLLKSFAL